MLIVSSEVATVASPFRFRVGALDTDTCMCMVYLFKLLF